MSRVRTRIVMKNDQLLRFAALNNLRRPSVELGFDLIDYWQYKGCQEAENKDIKLFCKISVRQVL